MMGGKINKNIDYQVGKHITQRIYLPVYFTGGVPGVGKGEREELNYANNNKTHECHNHHATENTRLR